MNGRRMTREQVTRMEVAPHDACVRCMKGDCKTAIGLRGEAEWVMAGIGHVLGDAEEAHGMVAAFFAEQGCDPGMVPVDEVEYTIMLCPECAAELRLPVGKIPGDVPTIEPRSEGGAA